MVLKSGRALVYTSDRISVSDFPWVSRLEYPSDNHKVSGTKYLPKRGKNSGGEPGPKTGRKMGEE